MWMLLCWKHMTWSTLPSTMVDCYAHHEFEESSGYFSPTIWSFLHVNVPAAREVPLLESCMHARCFLWRALASWSAQLTAKWVLQTYVGAGMILHRVGCGPLYAFNQRGGTGLGSWDAWKLRRQLIVRVFLEPHHRQTGPDNGVEAASKSSPFNSFH